jgi:hypothetical protein
MRSTDKLTLLHSNTRLKSNGILKIEQIQIEICVFPRVTGETYLMRCDELL